MVPISDTLALGGVVVILVLLARSVRVRVRRSLHETSEAQLREATALANRGPCGSAQGAVSQQAILAFLQGRGPDGQGRMLGDVLSFSDEQLEQAHDFIQWLFPSPQASSCHPQAPVASPETFEKLRADPLARKGLNQAFERMLQFYGLQAEPSLQWALVQVPGHDDVSGWLQDPTHNDLRLSRMMRAMSLCGEQAQADRLWSFLQQHFSSSTDPSRRLALTYWREAALDSPP